MLKQRGTVLTVRSVQKKLIFASEREAILKKWATCAKKLFKRDSVRAITLEELDKLVETISRMKVEERIRRLKLKPRSRRCHPACIHRPANDRTRRKDQGSDHPQRRLEGRRAVGHGVSIAGKCEHFAARAGLDVCPASR